MPFHQKFIFKIIHIIKNKRFKFFKKTFSYLFVNCFFLFETNYYFVFSMGCPFHSSQSVRSKQDTNRQEFGDCSNKISWDYFKVRKQNISDKCLSNNDWLIFGLLGSKQQFQLARRQRRRKSNRICPWSKGVYFFVLSSLYMCYTWAQIYIIV